MRYDRDELGLPSVTVPVLFDHLCGIHARFRILEPPRWRSLIRRGASARLVKTTSTIGVANPSAIWGKRCDQNPRLHDLTGVAPSAARPEQAPGNERDDNTRTMAGARRYPDMTSLKAAQIVRPFPGARSMIARSGPVNVLAPTGVLLRIKQAPGAVDRRGITTSDRRSAFSIIASPLIIDSSTAFFPLLAMLLPTGILSPQDERPRLIARNSMRSTGSSSSSVTVVANCRAVLLSGPRARPVPALRAQLSCPRPEQFRSRGPRS